MTEPKFYYGESPNDFCYQCIIEFTKGEKAVFLLNDNPLQAYMAIFHVTCFRGKVTFWRFHSGDKVYNRLYKAAKKFIELNPTIFLLDGL